MHQQVASPLIPYSKTISCHEILTKNITFHNESYRFIYNSFGLGVSALEDEIHPTSARCLQLAA